MINEKRLIVRSIIGTGISSITVQLVTIREFLSQFHGNEITISLVIFSWLLLTGIGSLIAKFFNRGSLLFIFIHYYFYSTLATRSDHRYPKFQGDRLYSWRQSRVLSDLLLYHGHHNTILPACGFYSSLCPDSTQ